MQIKLNDIGRNFKIGQKIRTGGRRTEFEIIDIRNDKIIIKPVNVDKKISLDFNRLLIVVNGYQADVPNIDDFVRDLLQEKGQNESSSETYFYGFARAFWEKYRRKGNVVDLISNEMLLKHFDCKPLFKENRDSWHQKDTQLFCRLAETVHSVGLDWYHINMREVRFGRKNKINRDAEAVLGIVYFSSGLKLNWQKDLGLSKRNKIELTDKLISEIKSKLKDNREIFEREFTLDRERTGYWPDQYITTFRPNLFPDELEGDWQYIEGAGKRIEVNAYERNNEARNKCLAQFGYSCSVCDFNFADKFGQIGVNFIHVHHLIPISSLKKSYHVDPVADLRPVCPNCHAMLHRANPPFSIDELKKIMRSK
jgi:hypothetical protein